MSSAVSAALQIHVLGRLCLHRRGAVIELPSSRKVRALIAYLALSPRAVSRSHLCEMFWEEPSDPRGELRWCLSKIRGVVDDDGRRRLLTKSDTVTLDLSGSSVDVAEIEAAAREGIQSIEPRRLEELSKRFTGDFLEGLELDDSPAFGLWLGAQRRHFRACHVAILEHLAGGLPVGSDAMMGYVSEWLQLAPFDRRAHEMLLHALARQGRLREGEEHLAATTRLFENEGLDSTPIRTAWITATQSSVSAATVASARKPAAKAQAASAAGRSKLAAEATVSKSADHPEAADRSDTADLVPTQQSVTPTPRASVAVMPFSDASTQNGPRGGLADGLTHDIITRLARLRNPFVIAQGTVFALDERNVEAEQAARTLDVDYLVSGALHHRRGRAALRVELSETRTARILWTEMFDFAPDAALTALDDIGNRIVAAIASEIEIQERNRAMLRPPTSLNAWEAYHRGLWHMYRFNRADNDRAHHFFQSAVRLDPTFSRAYSGLSFTHFQNAFLLRTAERQKEIERAFESAGQSLLIDNLDPAAHWAMGRALWLRGDDDQSLSELATAVELSPNFALGHYALAFVHSQSGDPHVAIASADYSRQLSPFDPLLFAMLAVRAIAHVKLGQLELAAEWSVKAARRPNAHAHILAIAAHTLAATNRLEEALTYRNRVRTAQPHYSVRDLVGAFHLSPEAESVFRRNAARLGFD